MLDGVIVIEAAHRVVLNLANRQLQSAEDVVDRLSLIAQLITSGGVNGNSTVIWAGMPSGALASRRSRCRATAGSASGTSTSKTLWEPGLATEQDVN